MEYLKSLAEEALGWFVGGAVAVLVTVPAAGLDDAVVWKGAALAGVAGVVKGLASKFRNDPERATLT